MAIFLFLLVAIILTSVTLYMLFPKLDIPAWKGAVPVLNYMEISEKVGRSKWYGLLTAVPIVNIFTVTGLSIALIRSFGLYRLKDAAIGLLYAPIKFFQMAKDPQVAYQGPILTHEKEYQQQINDAKKAGQEHKYKKLLQNNPYKKSNGREWLESIVFAVFAAAFIRMFLFEAYVIPTPSMEGSLLVGDYLFVSKMSYGLRTPQTVAMVPLLHNRIPGIGSESYLESPSLPYCRLNWTGGKVKRNDPIVFNWPVGDSVYITPSRSYSVDQIRQNPAIANSDPALKKMVKDGNYRTRPMDKKDHYVKRAIAIAGDTLEIRDSKVYIDGQPGTDLPDVQFLYQMAGNINSINPTLREELGLNQKRSPGMVQSNMYPLSEVQVTKLKEVLPSIIIRKFVNPTRPKELFPHDPKITEGWTVDDYGPIWIPAKGATIDLTTDNLPYYKKLIRDYEHNDLEIKGNQIFINGREAKTYTFQQDYYWAMGDNRHMSEDSRLWGFVPMDHMVGKPALIWFSRGNNGIRWNRIFKSASKI